MEFVEFITKDNVVEIFLGTMLAFGLNRFAESLERNVFRPFVKKNFRVTGNTKTGNVLSSLLELTVVVALVYLAYRFIMRRFRKNGVRNAITNVEKINVKE